MWSVFVLFMGPAYRIDAAGKFLLVSVPTLVGSVLRLPYTFAVARFGGRNWTIVSAALLLVPTILAAIVMHPGTSLTTFLIVAAVDAQRHRRVRRGRATPPDVAHGLPLHRHLRLVHRLQLRVRARAAEPVRPHPAAGSVRDVHPARCSAR
jgi:hypothetical protein